MNIKSVAELKEVIESVKKSRFGGDAQIKEIIARIEQRLAEVNKIDSQIEKLVDWLLDLLDELKKEISDEDIIEKERKARELRERKEKQDEEIEEKRKEEKAKRIRKYGFDPEIYTNDEPEL